MSIAVMREYGGLKSGSPCGICGTRRRPALHDPQIALAGPARASRAGTRKTCSATARRACRSPDRPPRRTSWRRRRRLGRASVPCGRPRRAERRRRVERAHPEVLHRLPRHRADLRREVDEVVLGDTPGIRTARAWSETAASAPRARRARRRGHGPLLDRPDRLAGHAIEREDEPLLGDLRDRLDSLAVDGDVEQVRRGRQVVVPQPVVHELVVPDALAGLDVEAHERLARTGCRRADGRRSSRAPPC